MNTFLQQTAQSIMASMTWQQLSRTTFVLPSHRAGLVLKDELLRLQQAQQAQAVWAPQVQTLTQLQDYLSPLYAEDELFTVVRLYKLYRHISLVNYQLSRSDIMSLDLFYNWGRQMISDFTNVDASMPAEQVANFFDNTIAAHELGQWQLDPEVEERLKALINPMAANSPDSSGESVKAQYEQLWQQLYELYQALHAEMETEQKGYPGMRQRAVIAHWEDEQIQSKIAGRTYAFVGFNYLLPVERDLMMRLRDNGQARFYWDFVRDFKTNAKAFSFARLNAGILGNDGHNEITNHQSPITLVSCVSKEAQAQYVHRWLQENYTAKGMKVGVVICDETMLEPVIYTLPAITLPGQDQPEPINITKGFPLRNTAVHARVLGWLYDRQRGDAEQALSPEFIDHLLDEILNQKSDILNQESEILNQKSAISWQELLILESEYQVRKVANQMRRLLADGLGDIPITLKMLRLLMRRTMESVTMPFHGEPVTDIQVMGVLETRLLDFDRLLLLNVDEGILPQRQADSSFIPFYLRKAYHMQTSDERATVYAYNFFRLLSRSGHTTVLYGQPDTIGGSRGMSRFVMQILYSDEFSVTRAELQEQAVVKPYDDASFRPKGSYLSTNHHRLSPSALNTFITCPRSFYLQYVEGVHEPEEEEKQFASSTLGSFVHHAMEYLYKRYLHCDNKNPVRVSPDEIEALRTDEAKLQEALMAAYRMVEEQDGKVFNPDEHVSENIIIKGYVRNILERDREDARVGLQIYLLEQDRRFPVTIGEAGEIMTGGTIDRLDIYGAPGNERLRIVDYKSGSYGDRTHELKMSSSWEDIMTSPDKDYVRQTLIYSHAVMMHDTTGLPIEPNLYFCRRRLTNITTTIDVEHETVSDYRAIQDRFLSALTAKVEEVMTTTDFPQCEEGDCPSFCPFFRLCGREPKEF